LRLAVAGVVLAAAAGTVVACGGSSAATPSAGHVAPEPGNPLSLAGVRVVPAISGPASVALPAGGAVVSFDIHGGSFAVGGRTISLAAAPSSWQGGAAWRHVEIAAGRVSVDGRTLAAVARDASAVAFGRAQVRALIVSPAGSPAALLFHRLAELHARVPARQFPSGASVDDRLYYDPGWTSGFYAGALWQAAALEPAGGMFERWALAATVEHLGMERSPTHDVGFMYGQSSLNAYETWCGAHAGRLPSLCARLRASVIAAADELVSLAGSNPGSGTIPTDPTSPEAETIIDSMMNIQILPWASAVTGNGTYRRLALHQARVIASALVRRDGSTAQSATFDRRTGALLSVTTHQGLSNRSTWARGEGWALYGFSVAALELRDRELLSVAQRVARYVVSHVPAGGVPPWDYNAPPGAPVDVSAGVISAAGLFHLAAACERLRGSGCGAAATSRWTALARRMLASAVGGYASARPPLGLLRSQIQDERWGGGCWCNHGELIYGLSYALEALRLAHSL
jgi:unsaturated chondroitin disaccharide hydrolase